MYIGVSRLVSAPVRSWRSTGSDGQYGAAISQDSKQGITYLDNFIDLEIHPSMKYFDNRGRELRSDQSLGG